MRRRLGVALLSVALVGSSSVPARAGFFPDPVEIAFLVRILSTTKRIFDRVQEMLATAKEWKGRVEDMFPDEVLNEIRSYFQRVGDIQEEMESLACDWRFSAGVEQFRLGLLKPGLICKDAYQRVFGRPAPSASRDLEEFRQWSAVRRHNTVASTFAAGKQWATAAHSLAAQARRAGTSVGEAERLEGVAEALGLEQATLFNKHAAELLSGLQEELDAERSREWEDKAVAHQILELAATASGCGPEGC